MAQAPGSSTRVSMTRLLLLALVVVVGVVLFFALARRTPTLISPAEVESHP